VATHRNLEEAVREGKFRQDAFHRVYVFPIHLPPLREHKEDIPALVEHFAREVCGQNNWKPAGFSADAIAALQSHAWPGNVRELRNTIERVILLSSDGQVTGETVRLAIPQNAAGAVTMGCGSLADRVQAFERETLLAELKRHDYHVTNVAKALGLERSHIYKKAEQLGLDLRALRHQSETE